MCSEGSEGLDGMPVGVYVGYTCQCVVEGTVHANKLQIIFLDNFYDSLVGGTTSHSSCLACPV